MRNNRQARSILDFDGNMEVGDRPGALDFNGGSLPAFAPGAFGTEPQLPPPGRRQRLRRNNGTGQLDLANQALSSGGMAPIDDDPLSIADGLY